MIDSYKQITDAIITSLTAGVKPWSRPWQTKGGAYMLDGGLPFNVVSGRNYRGLNIPLLWATTQDKGYLQHAYLSFRQATQLGGSVRKGQKATWVYFFKFLDKAEPQPDGTSKLSRIPLIRACPVFNIEQCEGNLKLPERVLPQPTKSRSRLGVVGPVVDRLSLTGGLHFNGHNRAFYSPGNDSIHMPKVEQFQSRDGFLATLLHECGHATGAKGRLARDFSGRFGDSAYAFEELVAELASAFSQAALGLRADIENHASYLNSWLDILQHDRHAFTRACSLAQAASDYMLGTK